MPRPPAKCGTISGYERHRNSGEQPCESCRAARAAYNRAWRTSPGRKELEQIDQSARRHAHQVLAGRYPDEYRTLFEAERDRRLGLFDYEDTGEL